MLLAATARSSSLLAMRDGVVLGNHKSVFVRAFSTADNKPFRTIGVAGFGLMGKGIAQVCAEAGYAVRVFDFNEQAVSPAGQKTLQDNLLRTFLKSKSVNFKDYQANPSLADVSPVNEILQRVRYTSKPEEFYQSGCDLIIEAIVENMEIKKSFYKEMGAKVPSETVLASNTSSFPIAVLAEASKRPAKVVGLHFFNPVPLMKLVEIVKTPSTDEAVVSRIQDFVQTIKKTPVSTSDTPGFIVNRLLVPFLAEAMAMVDRKEATVKDIDVAMKLGAGHPMGPLYLADYIGLDTCLNILKGWVKDHPEKGFFIPKCLETLVAEGKLGRKSGKGFYDW